MDYIGTGPRVAVIGGGSIGVAFALVFARGGWSVRVFDPEEARRDKVIAEVRARLDELRTFALIDEDADAILSRIEVCAELALALDQADLIEECAPERVELKRALFSELDRLAHPRAILASASSALTASSIADHLPGRHRSLIAHPGNPPYLIPVIEIVPAEFTDSEVVRRARVLFSSVGLESILVAKEVDGFVFNRLQGAVLREAYCLVRDGIASVEDIDTVMREGLGLRWSVVGPFETVDLNTRGGIASHAEKMGPAYAKMGLQRGQSDPWTPELVSKVVQARRSSLPLEQWDARVAWRDRELMARLRDKRNRTDDISED